MRYGAHTPASMPTTACDRVQSCVHDAPAENLVLVTIAIAVTATAYLRRRLAPPPLPSPSPSLSLCLTQAVVLVACAGVSDRGEGDRGGATLAMRSCRQYVSEESARAHAGRRIYGSKCGGDGGGIVGLELPIGWMEAIVVVQHSCPCGRGWTACICLYGRQMTGPTLPNAP